MDEATERRIPADMPREVNAALVLADGGIFFGYGVGAFGASYGEICFNTAMTGYQEILTDPSYAGQIITFTFPHIGNTGVNGEDIESTAIHARGLIIRAPITRPSNFRSTTHLNDWLKSNATIGISGVDTRRLTNHTRANGPQNVAIIHRENGLSEADIAEARQVLSTMKSLKGMELAKAVSAKQTYAWDDGLWQADRQPVASSSYHVVAVDYGVKHNILRNLVSAGCRVTVVPADTKAEAILALNPDGIFLSNGPGDPAATGKYALPEIRKLIGMNDSLKTPHPNPPSRGGDRGMVSNHESPITNHSIPIFGICLGHQLLALAMGCKTEKMHQGHRGANHPVKDLRSGKVLITSQNHGFVVSEDGLPETVEITHRSLFDGTIQGLAHKTKPIFCVQGHPEASPGPHDLFELFKEFVSRMETSSAATRSFQKKGVANG